MKQKCYSHNYAKFKIGKWNNEIAHPQCCKGWKIEPKPSFKAEVKANTASLRQAHKHIYSSVRDSECAAQSERCLLRNKFQFAFSHIRISCALR